MAYINLLYITIDLYMTYKVKKIDKEIIQVTLVRTTTRYLDGKGLTNYFTSYILKATSNNFT